MNSPEEKNTPLDRISFAELCSKIPSPALGPVAVQQFHIDSSQDRSPELDADYIRSGENLAARVVQDHPVLIHARALYECSVSEFPLKFQSMFKSLAACTHDLNAPAELEKSVIESMRGIKVSRYYEEIAQHTLAEVLKSFDVAAVSDICLELMSGVGLTQTQRISINEVLLPALAAAHCFSSEFVQRQYNVASGLLSLDSRSDWTALTLASQSGMYLQKAAEENSEATERLLDLLEQVPVSLHFPLETEDGDPELPYLDSPSVREHLVANLSWATTHDPAGARKMLEREVRTCLAFQSETGIRRLIAIIDGSPQLEGDLSTLQESFEYLFQNSNSDRVRIVALCVISGLDYSEKGYSEFLTMVANSSDPFAPAARLLLERNS